MEKTVVSEDYRVLLKTLREVRERNGISQMEIARRLEMTQSMVSKCERGERRLDVIELRQWCRVGLEVPLQQLLDEFETALTKGKKKRARRN